MIDVKCKFCGYLAEKYVFEDIGEVCPECKQQKILLEGVTDRVEILKIIYQTERRRIPDRAYIPKKPPLYELFEELDDQEIERLVQFVMEHFPNDKQGHIMEMIENMAAFTNGDLGGIHPQLIGSPYTLTPHVFRNANPSIASELISSIEDIPNGKYFLRDVNCTLMALAWVGTENVISQFVDWHKHPPKWADKLNAPPMYFTTAAGWELDQNFKRRNLILDHCYPLYKSSDESTLALLKTCQPSEQACKWCGGIMTHLLEFNLTDPFFEFIPFQGNKLTFVTCEPCATCSYARIFMEVGPEGEAVWSPYNVEPDGSPYDNSRMPVNALRLSRKPRLLHHAADWCLPSPHSQVGGIASWRQDTDYAACPKCEKKMRFIAQMAVDEAEPDGVWNGTFYAMLCSDCSLSLITFQNT